MHHASVRHLPFVSVTGAIASWRALIGPTNSDKARADAPQSLRARFGTDGTQNACHGSDAPDTAAAELGFFFEQVSCTHPLLVESNHNSDAQDRGSAELRLFFEMLPLTFYYFV